MYVRRVAEDEVAIEELLPLLHLALEDRAEIVLIADDVRREDEERGCVFVVRLRASAEEHAEHRDVAEDRDLRLARCDRVAHEAADHDRLLILHDERGLRGALVDRDRAERCPMRRAALGDLLGELEAHLVRVVDVRRDLDLGADVLARRREAAAAEAAEPAEGAERAGRARRPRRATPSRRAADVRLERDVLADVDLGGDVVGREDVRRREHVRSRRSSRARASTTPNAGMEMPGAEEVLRSRDGRTAHAEREALRGCRDR